MPRRSATASGEPIEKVRYCNHPDCNARLSMYNHGKQCFAHQKGKFAGVSSIAPTVYGTVQHFGDF